MKYSKTDIFELASEIYTNIHWAKFYNSEMSDELNKIFDKILIERDLLDDWIKYLDGELDSKE